MFALRHVLPYPIIALFVLFSFSESLSDHIQSFTSLSKNREPPDFSHYHQLRTLPANQFPLDDPRRRAIIVGDVHGMQKQLSALLDKLSFDPASDVLIHVGDILTRGPHDGSMAVLSYMTSNNITGVRGNHDQKVIEWRAWMNWIRNLPKGKEWLDALHTRWVEAEANGATPNSWVKEQKKKKKCKWWRTIPKGWKLFSDHYHVARAMSEAQYDYLLSLPLRLYIPSSHTFIVHGGFLSSDPHYSPNDSRQPLAHVPSLPLDIVKGGNTEGNETTALLRGLQERALLEDIPQNKDAWTVLNLRSIIRGKASNRKSGKAWHKIWKQDMSRCDGFNQDLAAKPKDDLLPCYPSSVIYGHTASRGLNVKRWSFGLDTGCVYYGRLTALVLGPPNLRSLSLKRQGPNEDGNEDSDYVGGVQSFPFGDDGKASIVSISCS